MKTNNRRRFIKNTVLALGATPLLSNALINKNENSVDNSKIIYRTLGKTGLKLPVISMGTGDTDNPKLVEMALDKGIKLLATSQYYGNGNNETMLGGVLKTRKRDSYMIASSAMPEGFDHKTGTFKSPTNGKGFIEQVNESLKRLNVEYLDILFLPFMATRESVFNDDYLQAMEQLKKDGKTKFIGIATHKFEHEAIRAAVDVKIYDLVMTQYNFRKTTIDELNKSIDYAVNAGLGIIAMKTMAGAFWDKERTKPINTKAALKWVLQNPNIHTTVPGFTNFEQLQQNIDLMANLELTEAEKSDLVAQNPAVNGVYCEQCNNCIPQCPYSLDIPTYMRSFMYAYGYKNLKTAQQTLQLATSPNPCELCDTCKVNCKMGFDIKRKITDIMRLRNVPTDFIS